MHVIFLGYEKMMYGVIEFFNDSDNIMFITYANVAMTLCLGFFYKYLLPQYFTLASKDCGGKKSIEYLQLNN